MMKRIIQRIRLWSMKYILFYREYFLLRVFGTWYRFYYPFNKKVYW